MLVMVSRRFQIVFQSQYMGACLQMIALAKRKGVELHVSIFFLLHLYQSSLAVRGRHKMSIIQEQNIEGAQDQVRYWVPDLKRD